MTNLLNLPFTLGDVYWRSVGHPVEVVYPCPACQGTRTVTLLCPNGDTYVTDCEGCRMGTIRQWEVTPTAVRFVVAEVVGLHNGEWRVSQGYGDAVEFRHLYATEAEALAAATVDADRHTEHNMMFRANSRKRAAGKATWTVRYSKNEISKAEAIIAWHRARLRLASKKSGS